jgi:membrane protein
MFCKGVMSRYASALSRARRYLNRGLWTADISRHRLRGRIGIRVLRLVVVIVRAPAEAQINLEATALVYRTLLSIVPLLAVAFSLLKAFDAQYRMEPLVARLLAPLGAAGTEIATRIVGFVSNLSVSVLGAVGLLGLFYTVVSVIEKIEDALNRIWHVRQSRSLVRKFSDYLSVLLVGPVLVFAALGLIASTQSRELVQRVLARTPFAPEALAVLGQVVPFVLLVVAFTLLYRFLPYARVAPDAALVGGVTAAILWQLASLGFAALVAGSTRYAAIYSSFAVFIVFLLWLQLAWLVVLVGGEVAYVHQHPTSYVAVRGRPSALLRERVGLATLVEITRRYLAGERPPRLDDLARLLGAPLAIVDDVVADFIVRGFLARAVEPAGVVLARPPEAVPVTEVLEAIREPGLAALDFIFAHESVASVLRRRDDAVEQALDGVTLRSLATGVSTPEPAVANLSDYRRR